MNKKAQAPGFNWIIVAVLSFLCIIVLIGLAATFIPQAASSFFDAIGNSANEIAQRFLGINFEIEEQKIELSALQPEQQNAFRGIYETFLAGKEDTDNVGCLLEYPKIANLKRNAIAFEKDSNRLEILFVDEQGKRMQIEGFDPITGLEPCFVAGKQDGEVVAQNFYKHWFEEGSGGKLENITGYVKMWNQDQNLDAPDTLEVTGNSKIKKGTRYFIYVSNFLYKADEGHICFIPEITGFFVSYACAGGESGLQAVCFKTIKDNIPCCSESVVPGTCEIKKDAGG